MARNSMPDKLDALIPLMIDLYAQGESVAAIAVRLKTTFSSVKKRLVSQGIRIEQRRARGEKHWKWKGGKTREDGYVLVKNPLYPVLGDYYIRRSRLVWQQAFGFIPAGHEIHHLNGNKTDDRLENLCCLSKKVHGRYIPQKEFVKKLQYRIRSLERELESAWAQQIFDIGKEVMQSGGRTS